jgi:hypothetical protein
MDQLKLIRTEGYPNVFPYYQAKTQLKATNLESLQFCQLSVFFPPNPIFDQKPGLVSCIA